MAEPRLLSGVFSNWSKFLAVALISFFLSPFLVRHLGPFDYGLWSELLSTVAYFKLLDLGMNSGVVRFTARDAALANTGGLSRTIATSRVFFAIASAVIVLLTLVGTVLVPNLFHVPHDVVDKARVCFLLAGIDLAITFAFAVWNASLVGLQRYGAINAWTMALLGVKTVFLVLLVRAGFGVRTIALVSLIESTLRGLGLSVLARRLLPGVDVGMRLAEPSAFREIASYNVYAFLIAASIQVIGPTDLIVVGRFLSTEKVTPYDFGRKFVDPLYDLLWAAVMILTPLAASYEARRERESLRRLHLIATKGVIVLALPAIFFFVAAGHDFLRRWVGAAYADDAYPVLAVLTSALFLAIAQQPGVAVLKGIGHVRAVAFLYVGEAVANLALSIALVRSMGLFGVAIGTAIPLAISNGIVLPIIACRALGTSVASYVREAIVPAMTPAVPAFVLGFAAVRGIGPIDDWGSLAAVFGGSLLLFWLPAFFLTFTRLERRSLLDRVRAELRARRSPEISP
ncbi:MAG: polysaccharide biosynthesis C-terminal domain-containing protein [Planctomycetes bacterium]|nr:polysaccharide biosynthesis C-terminal domain-containing protein [Planctomycetota bacterium]MBI3847365.1 polysaccharide biosynthesis C-terminal domain-containing protein [Planctomycetota bacterium]